MTVLETTTETLASWSGADAIAAMRAIRAAGVVRCKDAMRQPICGVLLTLGQAVATDTYHLATVTLDYQGSDVLLPSVVVTAITKVPLPALKRGEKDSSYEFTIARSGRALVVTFGGRDGTQLVTCDELEYGFPAWAHLMPERYEMAPECAIGFRADNLKCFASVLKALDLPDETPVVLVHLKESENKPTVWEIRSNTVLVRLLAMPVRVPWRTLVRPGVG